MRVKLSHRKLGISPNFSPEGIFCCRSAFSSFVLLQDHQKGSSSRATRKGGENIDPSLPTRHKMSLVERYLNHLLRNGGDEKDWDAAGEKFARKMVPLTFLQVICNLESAATPVHYTL